MKTTKVLSIRRVPITDTVCDIQTETGNFFVKSSTGANVLVSNCFLKPLEEPPKRTLWILCTTNPEKLPATILGRCHKFNVKRIEPDVMAKRLSRIAKKEGTDFKERKDGKEILKFICDLSNGRMRDSISLLEKALAAIASGDNLDAKALMETFLQTDEADLEKGSANLLIAMLNNDLKSMMKVVRACTNARGLLNKTRWLLMYLLDNAVGLAKYAPYNAKLFTALAQKGNVSVNLPRVVRLQFLLLEIEFRFNSMSVDENVVMLSMLGNEIALAKAEK